MMTELKDAVYALAIRDAMLQLAMQGILIPAVDREKIKADVNATFADVEAEHAALCALADFVATKLHRHGDNDQWIELNRLCAVLSEIRGRKITQVG